MVFDLFFEKELHGARPRFEFPHIYVIVRNNVPILDTYVYLAMSNHSVGG
jgi:hypothetical protein